MPRFHPQPLASHTPRRVLLILSVLAGVSWVIGCKRPAPHPLSATERRQITVRFREVIERAGRSRVWIKGAPSRDWPLARTHLPIEVLTASAAFDAVLSAIQGESQRQGLEVQCKPAGAQTPWRSMNLTLSRRREEICRWQVREVGQIRRAAIVIDDLGQDLEAARKLAELPYPLTLSVLPHLRHSFETARQARRSGREVMLHLPMEAEPGWPTTPGPGAIKLGMSAREVEEVIQADLASVPYVSGVNNHMGSRATGDARLMEEVMRVLAGQHLYFVDSRTTGASVALDAARRLGLPAFYRAVFLDDTPSVAYTLGQFRKFRRVVESHGAALAIGHPYPTTLKALTQALPELEREDIELVPASRLVHLPEVARLSPPRPPRGE